MALYGVRLFDVRVGDEGQAGQRQQERSHDEVRAGSTGRSR